ncbi:hypothetical protein CH276_07440 [Rhodococcus sp. 06-470-2]|uniref:hypothetical protein n=1 Tax=unclassified Rhodococcus (in: high G+C Gram-positive bacteria) TaxID=192944 RepID=UPI000B9C3655|nr:MULTISPECIES: hypothetical protein [unclassified Rhodococcus (in: high G+C Gram-positive bacteria)]OZC67021.1 hypothetical protein CH276_07440 [Rhodococcus sp. 06-470-2]OZE58693.1 hypothetical protein CH265_21725 [Rhodococcus sp. 05-2221-1B]
MEFFVWANLWLALPLGIIGFAITLWQVLDAKKAANRAKSAADAAEDAAKEASKAARSQVRSIQVASIGPHLMRLEENIDSAIERQSSELLNVSIVNWRLQATTYKQFLDPNIPNELALSKKIQKAILPVNALKLSIISFDNSTDWASETEKVRKAVNEVTAEVGAIIAQQSIEEA